MIWFLALGSYGFVLAVGFLIGCMLAECRHIAKARPAGDWNGEALSPYEAWIRRQPDWVLESIAAGTPPERYGWSGDIKTLH